MAFIVIQIIILIITLVWLGFLTFQVYNTKTIYNELVQGTGKKTLDDIFKVFLSDLSHAKKDIAELNTKCDKIEKNQLFYIQKIGLLRFNPFNDTGGDQSFILTLSDANDTGVVITGLYSRSGTRWYAKKVIAGKGSEHDLSEEEKKALRIAKNLNQIK